MVNLYENREEVFIKATIRGIVVEEGTIKYLIRNNATGIDEKCPYTEEQIFPITQSAKRNVTEASKVTKPRTKKQ